MNFVIIFNFLVLFIYTVSSSEDDNKNFKQIDSIYPEEACTSSGGMCVIEKDCHHGQLAEKGLCPQQQRQGVECCYGLSEKETRCRKRGGDCSETPCRRPFHYTKATDCPANTYCCIYV